MRLKFTLPRGVLIIIIMVQIYTHLNVFSISAHSGQIAIPFMMNHGGTLFGNLLEQHAPATSVIAAIIQRFVALDPLEITRGLHIVLISALILLVYVISARLSRWGETAGVLAAVVWFWWLPVYGNILFYFDTLLGFFVCLGIAILLFSDGKRGHLFISGLCFGMATLAKQHAWGAVILALLWIVFMYRQRVALFIIGLLILPLFSIGVFVANGTLANYIYWNWTFNLTGVMDSEPPNGDFVRKVALSNIFVPAFILQTLIERHSRWLLIAAVGLMTMVTMLPRFGLIHVTAHLPFSAIMSGVVLAEVISVLGWRSILSQLRGDVARVTLVGVLAMLMIAWGWTGIATYFPTDLGRGSVPAYDEFKQLSARLQALAQPDDTLFILPETDSTPQIHVMADLLPPGTWVKGWSWYFEAPGLIETLLSEWQTTPPTYIVVFPDLLEVGEPGIQPLVDFVSAHYRSVETVSNVVFHGDAIIYQWQAVPETP